jgi:HlyD family secretion protein
MKRIVLILLALVLLLVVGWLALGFFQGRSQAAALRSLQTEAAQRSNLKVTVDADGSVRARQTAELSWKTSGTVDKVYVAAGDVISTSETLASLDQSSLPQAVILAQASLADAQRTLDNLRESNTQQAQALKAVEEAQQVLDDARDPRQAQSSAQTQLAEAQKALDTAQRQYEILTKPPTQAVIDQAHANMLLAQKVLDDTQHQIDVVDKKLHKNPKYYLFFESRDLYRKILENLKTKRLNDRIAYDNEVKRYNALLQPPDANDVAVAQANLDSARAQVAQAQRQSERLKNGSSPADLAVLEAQLADAQREWERLKNGPDTADITAAQARLEAAQAAVSMAYLNAPFSGVVTSLLAQPGDQVNPGTLALRLDDTSRMFAEVLVTEVDINRMQEGMPVILTFDALPGKEYHGTVVDIPVVGQSKQGVSDFKVTVEITDANGTVKPGMTTTASFVINDLKDVLIVPNRALRFQDGQRFVYVVRNGQVLLVNVTLGAASNTSSQVLEGDIKPGDEVVVSGSAEQINQASSFRPRLIMRINR